MDTHANIAAWSRVVERARETDSRVSLSVASAACAADTGADSFGLTLISTGQIRSVAYASDERAYRLEDAQLVSGEGPCTEAYSGRRALGVDLRDRPDRWPLFEETASELGVRGVTAAPLLIGSVPIGALDLYRMTEGPLSRDEMVRLDAFARVIALLTVEAYPGLLDQADEPAGPGPHGYPPLVHRAAGMAAARDRVDVDEALIRMRAHALSHHEALQTVAHDVLDGRLILNDD